MGMDVDHAEVELAGDQEDRVTDGRQACEAAGAALGCLGQAVECFEKAVGLTGLRSGNDALEVPTHEHGYLLHGFEDPVPDGRRHRHTRSIVHARGAAITGRARRRGLRPAEFEKERPNGSKSIFAGFARICRCVARRSIFD